MGEYLICDFVSVGGARCDHAASASLDRLNLCDRHRKLNARRVLQGRAEAMFRRAQQRGLVSQAEALIRAEAAMRKRLMEWSRGDGRVVDEKHARPPMRLPAYLRWESFEFDHDGRLVPK